MGLLKANDDEVPLGPLTEEALPYSRAQKALIAAVAGVGLLIMAGVGVVIFTVVNRLGSLSDTPKGAPEATTAFTIPAGAQLALPKGAEVQEMALDGARLAIRYQSAAGKSILIYDLATAKPIGTVALGP
ncbi:MAG: hypothetical protein U1E49_04290 [Hyphomicrobiaceae bacterium]